MEELPLEVFLKCSDLEDELEVELLFDCVCEEDEKKSSVSSPEESPDESLWTSSPPDRSWFNKSSACLSPRSIADKIFSFCLVRLLDIANLAKEERCSSFSLRRGASVNRLTFLIIGKSNLFEFVFL